MKAGSGSLGLMLCLSTAYNISPKKWKFSVCPSYEPMESQVNSCGPQNISGASQQNSDAALSWTTEVGGDNY